MSEELQAQAAEVVKSLKVCASGSCKHCGRTLGYGCARDLKRDAAAIIEKLTKEEKK